MRLSYNWLRELLPALEASPAQLGERLTAAGLEVEALARFGQGLEQRVVCGASNVPEPGMLRA